MRVTTKITDTDKGLKKILNALGIKEAYTTVGLHKKEGEELKKSPMGDGPEELIDVAAAHEFGIGTPQRSYLRSTIDENRGRYEKGLIEIAEVMFSPKSSILTMTMELANLGKKVQKDITDKITSGVPPELTPASIDRKTEYPGISIETPLVWTGQLADSITKDVKVKT